MQWVDNERWQFPLQVVQDLVTNEYIAEENYPFQWHTKDGNAPKGWPNFQNLSVDVPEPLFYAILSVSSLTVVVEVATLVKLRNFFHLFGCSLLNIASIIIAIPTEMVDNLLPVCITRLVFVSVGVACLSILSSFNIVKLWHQLISRISKQISSTLSRFSSVPGVTGVKSGKSSSRILVPEPTPIRSFNEKKAQVIAICLFIVHCAVLTAWLVIDHHEVKESIDVDNTEYDQITDTFTSYSYKDCTSQHFSKWAAALVLGLVVPMIFLTLALMMSGRVKKAKGHEKLVIVSIINIITLVLMCTFATFIVNSLVVQRIIIAVACWILSTSTSAIAILQTK